MSLYSAIVVTSIYYTKAVTIGAYDGLISIEIALVRHALLFMFLSLRGAAFSVILGRP